MNRIIILVSAFLCTYLHGNTQNIGINVSNPSEDLHIRTTENKVAIRLDNYKSAEGINYESALGLPVAVQNHEFNPDYLNWTDLDYTKLLNDDDIRLTSPAVSGWDQFTNTLRVQLNFENSIPANATIEDLIVHVQWKRNGPTDGELRLSQLYLQQASTETFLYLFGLQNISSLTDQNLTLPYEAELSPVTIEMLNTGDVFLSVYPMNTYSSGTHNLEIDQIALEVSYSVPATGTEQVYWTEGVKEGNFLISNSEDLNTDVHFAISEIGLVKMKELRITKNAGAGKILMSNNKGRAYWTDLPASNVQEIDDLIDGKTANQNLFLGNQAGMSLTGGTANVGVGAYSMSDLTDGTTNTALGVGSLHDNTNGNGNTAVGNNAMSFSFNGSNNTAVGLESMFYNYSGMKNVALGYKALYWNDNADYNVAIGPSALYNNTGDENLAIGKEAMYSNVNNSRSTALGIRSMFFAGNQTAGVSTYNTAVGYESLRGDSDPSLNTGKFNTAMGDQALYFNTGGNYNVAIGADALHNNKANSRSTAIGYRSMFYANNTSGFGSTYNTALGYSALEGSDNASANTGKYNTAIGDAAMNSNTTGDHNTTVGADCLFSNTEGDDNVGMGYRALYENTIGEKNVGLGIFAMTNNVDGSYNVALGTYSLFNNQSGDFNTALGYNALYQNSTTQDNTAVGHSAMEMLTIGGNNTAVGKASLFNISNGTSNTAIGDHSGFGSSGNSFTQCTFIGADTSPTSSRTNVTMLGYGMGGSLAPGDNMVAIGNTAITEVRAQVSGLTAYSDARIKSNVMQDVPGLDFVNRLRPVSYNQNPELLYEIWGGSHEVLDKIDHSQIQSTRFVGFIAQEVEQASSTCGYDFPGLDIPENNHQAYALRYVDFIMPLTKAVQELSEKNDELKAENESLNSRLDLMEQKLAELEALIKG